MKRVNEQHTVKLYRAATKERDQLRADARLLLQNLDLLQTLTSFALCPNDEKQVERIRADLNQHQ